MAKAKCAWGATRDIGRSPQDLPARAPSFAVNAMPSKARPSADAARTRSMSMLTPGIGRQRADLPLWTVGKPPHARSIRMPVEGQRSTLHWPGRMDRNSTGHYRLGLIAAEAGWLLAIRCTELWATAAGDLCAMNCDSLVAARSDLMRRPVRVGDQRRTAASPRGVEKSRAGSDGHVRPAVLSRPRAGLLVARGELS